MVRSFFYLTAIVGLLAFGLSSVAFGETFYDKNGRVTGTMTHEGNHWVTRDRDGRVEGRSSVEGGHMVYRDRDNKFLGSSRK